MGPNWLHGTSFLVRGSTSTSASDQRQRICAYDFARVFDFEAITVFGQQPGAEIGHCVGSSISGLGRSSEPPSLRPITLDYCPGRLTAHLLDFDRDCDP